MNNNGAEACEPPGTALCTSTCMIRSPFCGDGFLTPPEQCEDGNMANGDGCTSGCVLEFCGDGIVNGDGAEACEPPGTASCTDVCTDRSPLCGDGHLTAPEQCEDSNQADGDGCTSSCLLEFCGDGVVNDAGLEACEPPGTAECTESCTFRGTECGDGFLTEPEECEDGNVANGDGCSSGCLIEYCGDGAVNDGGTEGCEPPGTSYCADDCTVRAPICGDGYRTPPEQCEDGNLTDGDGCTSACVPEFCGDGVVNNDGTEDCEPPATAACRDDCSVRTALCGDGFLTAPEQCDDGNVTVDDGCSADCKVEIPAFCGDGSLDEDEECDDGNLDDGDGCSQSCVLEDSDIPDGGMPMPDAGIPIPDGGVASPDAGVALPDGGVGDAGDSPEPGPGLRNGTVTGGCSVGRGTAPVDPAILLALLGLVLSRRRRAHRLIPERSGGGSEDHLRDRRYPSRGRRSRLA